MADRGGSAQTSLCSVERGLYAFRYGSTRLDPAPVVGLRVVSGSVVFVAAPGRAPAELTDQGQVIVFVVETPSIVEVSVETLSQAVMPEASFSLDLLDRGVRSDHLISTAMSGVKSPDREYRNRGGSSFEIEAHVARVGDVRVLAGQWIAGPELPLPIEGLTLVEGQHSLGIEIQVRSAVHPGTWSPWSGPGRFVGTRQRAEHLTGIRLKLPEARDAAWTIVAEALFLGAAVVRREGSSIEFSSRDPLVGLKVDVVSKELAVSSTAQMAHRKIQVFRAQ